MVDTLPHPETEMKKAVEAAKDLEQREGNRWHTMHEIALEAGWITQEHFDQGGLPIADLPDDYFADSAMWICWISAARAAGWLKSTHRRADGRLLLHTIGPPDPWMTNP